MVRRRRREAVEEQCRGERGKGRKRGSSEVLFLFWNSLFIEHAVAPYQNHMAVADNDDVTIGK